MGVVGVVVVIATAIPILTVAMIPVLGLCYYYAERYLQVSCGACCFPVVSCVFCWISCQASLRQLERVGIDAGQ